MRYLVAILISCLLLTFWPASGTASESGLTSVWAGDWNGHEVTIVVINRGHVPDDAGDPSISWWEWGNTSSDAYLFFWSEDDMVDLILDFSTDAGTPTARLYVPKTTTGRQSLAIYDGYYEFDEDIGPDLVVSPREGTWIEDDLPNYNLEGLEANPTTGEFEWAFEVGSEEPGIPQWMTQEVLESHAPGIGYPHFGATKRMDDSIPFNPATPLMPSWPYLSVIDQEGHFGQVQPIFFSHETRMIELNWTGFHIAGMYQINSITHPPYTNFESPFAFYQFDESADYYANMVIRSDIWPAGDANGPSPTHQQRTAVRMTWTDEDPNLWRYSLSVGGGHAHDQTVMIGDTEIVAIPYDDYPEWITEREWSAVTFVEAVDGETGSEGIYDYSVEDNYPITEWISGLRVEPPLGEPEIDPSIGEPTLELLEQEAWATFDEPYLEFPEIHPLRLDENFRGEYSIEYDREPELYFSPIDNRVHLKYAHEGIWNLGDRRVLRVANADGDAYIDSWWIERVGKADSHIIDGVSGAAPGHVEERLFDLGDYLLYTSDNRIEFRELDSSVDNRPVQLPTEEETWRSFLQSASSDRHGERDPENFGSWIRAINGKSFALRRAEISDVRKTGEGFRFVLELKRNFRTAGRDFAGISELGTGEYLVEYDGEFTVTPLGPSTVTATLSLDNVVALQREPIALTIQNEGLRDFNEATVEVIAISPDGQDIVVSSNEVDLLAGSTLTDTIQWAAPDDGIWTLRTRLKTAGRRTYQHEPLTVAVSPAEGQETAAMLSQSITSSRAVTAFSALLVLSAIAGMIWWTQALPPHSGGRNDRER